MVCRKHWKSLAHWTPNCTCSSCAGCDSKNGAGTFCLDSRRHGSPFKWMGCCARAKRVSQSHISVNQTLLCFVLCFVLCLWLFYLGPLYSGTLPKSWSTAFPPSLLLLDVFFFWWDTYFWQVLTPGLLRSPRWSKRRFCALSSTTIWDKFQLVQGGCGAIALAVGY